VINFVNSVEYYSFLFPLVQKSKKNQPRHAGIIVKNKVARFYGGVCMCVSVCLVLSMYCVTEY